MQIPLLMVSLPHTILMVDAKIMNKMQKKYFFDDFF